MKLIFENAPQSLFEALDSNEAEILKSTSVAGVDFQYDDTPEGRWEQMKLAAEGARLWSDTPNPNSPLYAGPLPKDYHDIELVLADAEFAANRAKYYADFKVTYIGRTDIDPRNLLVVDHKRAEDQRHDTVLRDALRDALSAAPADWWGSLGIVSAGSSKRLEGFLEALPDVIPMAYSSGAVSKLKFAGREYAHLLSPKPEAEYGVDMRQRTNDLSARLAHEESAPEAPEEN